MDHQRGPYDGLRELALFAGAGGGILGGHLQGWRTVCAVEKESYATAVLIARQNEGILPPFPIWDDVRTFDGNPWRGIVEVVSGGFPCQDISAAGKGDGLSGERSGLWREMARIVGEVQPRYVFVENSPLLTRRGGERVVADLAAMGYICAWGNVSAADVGAPHLRERFWLVAYAEKLHCAERYIDGEDSEPQAQQSGSDHCASNVENTNNIRTRGFKNKSFDEWRENKKEWGKHSSETYRSSNDGEQRIRDWWTTEPDMGRVAYGMAAVVDRLAAIGNGQVPLVAAVAFRILADRIHLNL